MPVSPTDCVGAGMASEYRIASDGLPVRESGDWAKEKLYYAERSMSIFNGAMHRIHSIAE